MTMIKTCCPFFSGLRKTSKKNIFKKIIEELICPTKLGLFNIAPFPLTESFKTIVKRLIFKLNLSFPPRTETRVGTKFLKIPKKPPERSHLKPGAHSPPPGCRRGADGPVFEVTVSGHQESSPGAGND